MKLNVLIEFFSRLEIFWSVIPLALILQWRYRKNHKNIYFTSVTKKDEILLPVVRMLRGAIQSPSLDLENLLKREIYALGTGTPGALIFN